MAVYAIGDLQGCLDELQDLLTKLQFDRQHDQLWLVGDLVNRGPQSLETLRFVKSLGDSVITVLGNHDLHLLALAATDTPQRAEPDLQPILQADDSSELLDWLRHRPLLHFDPALNTALVHAGIVAEWTIGEALEHAEEVTTVLRSAHAANLLSSMYGVLPNRWSEDLQGPERLRFIINSFTRMRYCRADGSLEFTTKDAPAKAPAELQPWFRLAKRRTADTRIVFGHWSTLGLITEANLVALDTGCVWGGPLTAVRLDQQASTVQVPSHQPPAF